MAAYQWVYDSHHLQVGNATRIPENPGNPPVFKPVNPGLCAGKNPGLMGLNFGCQYCTEKSTLAVIKSDKAVFECSGVRGRILQLVYSYLQ